jgi:hypothetical protein
MHVYALISQTTRAARPVITPPRESNNKDERQAMQWNEKKENAPTTKKKK